MVGWWCPLRVKSPDLTLAREIFVQMLEHRERALADLGFQDPRFFKPRLPVLRQIWTLNLTGNIRQKWLVTSSGGARIVSPGG